MAKHTPRLTDAQRSYLKRLYLIGGHDRLFAATYQTAAALHDKGLVIIEISTPVDGRVKITDDGERIAKAIVSILTSPKRRLDPFSLAAIAKAEGA